MQKYKIIQLYFQCETAGNKNKCDYGTQMWLHTGVNMCSNLLQMTNILVLRKQYILTKINVQNVVK